MPVIPTGTAQVNMNFTGDAAPYGAEVTFGVDNATGLTALQIATAVETAWNSHLKSKTNSLLTLDSIRVKKGPNATGVFVVKSVGTAGTQVSSPVSPQVAMLIDKITLLGGRKNRGKWFWPGLPEAHVSAQGLIGSVDITAYNTALASFLAALTTADIPMLILHNDATSPTAVTELLVSSKVATLRDRLRRR